MLKSRGTDANPTPRFEAERRGPVDDGWGPADDDPPTDPRTTVSPDATRSIITRNDSPDIAFDRSINPYRGCEHGCIYCFARPSHAYLGLSPGLDFETRLLAKPNAAALLVEELRRPSYRPAPIAMGTNTDPYQPVERRLRITRAVLEVLAACDHPLTITTKSALVLRDLDLLAPMAARNLARVAISVTTLERDLARRLEPRASVPARRLATIRALAAAGVPTAVMVAPVIPALTDHELERILAAAAEAGAASAGFILLRLPLEVAPLFEQWLHTHAPARAGHVLSLIRQSRGGALNRSDWGTRMTGTGGHAEMLAQRFRLATRRLGLAANPAPLECAHFRPPTRPGDQLRLF